MADISHLAAIDGEMHECFAVVQEAMYREAFWASLADWVKTVGQNGRETWEEIFAKREPRNLAIMLDAGRDFLAYYGLLAITREVIDRQAFEEEFDSGRSE